MKIAKILTAFTVTVLSGFNSVAQMRAITDNGEEVMLKDDGTWKYASIKKGYTTVLDTASVEKSKDATFLLKGKQVKYGIYLNPKKWKFESSKEEEAQEYQLSLKSGDAYAMVIPERIELTYQLLEQVAISNAIDVAPDIRISHQEMRKVNGVLVKMMEMTGTIRGVAFTYLGYYYVGKHGTIQFLTYTANSVYEESKAEMEELLNGFTILE